MDNINYLIFELIYFKNNLIDFFDYSLVNYDAEEKINQKTKDLKNELANGTIKEIISNTFTNYKKVTKPIIIFLKECHKWERKAINNKTKNILNYNQKLIEAIENTNNIIKSFYVEKEISEKISPLINDYNKIIEEYYLNYAFFNFYAAYINCDLKGKHEQNKQLIKKILNYYNKNDSLSSAIEELEQDNKENIQEQMKKLSNKCINIEKEKNNLLKEITEVLNNASNK